MGQNFLIDTNILIYYFNGLIPEIIKSDISKILKNSFNVSIITVIEFLGYHKFNNKQYSLARHWVNNSNIFKLTDEISFVSIDLKRNYNLKLGDALIAATAMVNKLILVSRNEKDFTKLKNFKIFNPFNS